MSAWRTLRILRFNAVRPHTHGIFQRYAEALWLGSVILGKCECMERQRAANNSSEKAWQFHRCILLSRQGAVKFFLGLNYTSCFAVVVKFFLWTWHVGASRFLFLPRSQLYFPTASVMPNTPLATVGAPEYGGT